MFLSFVTATLAALAAVSPIGHTPALRIMQQDPPPDYQPGYTPDSSLPVIEADASAPITIPIKFTPRSEGGSGINDPNGGTPVVYPDTFTFTITGKDLDTWKRNSDNTLTQFADPSLVCASTGEQWPMKQAPIKRGTTNNVTTWILDGEGIVVLTPVSPHQPAVTYVNTYLIGNAAGRHNSLLDDDPVTVQQMLTRPAY